MGLSKFKTKAWAWTVIIGLILWFCGPIRPAGVSLIAWHMFAIFVATIVGCITQPLPIAGTTLVGFTVMVLAGITPMDKALTAFGNSSAWLIAMAFMLSRGFIKTGLGRRIALIFVRNFGQHSLGLAYSIMGIDLVTSPAIPSNTARAGGVVYPIVKSLAETYGSDPKKGTRKKIGSFLVFSEFHSNLITSATFMTAMAPNLVVVALAKTLHINITWLGWFIAGLLPSLICLIATPYIIYKMYPPEVKETPNAKSWADDELKKMGPMKLSEKLMGLIFILTLVLWMLTSFIPAIDATFVAFLAISLLLITGVLDTKDLLHETGAWNVLIWLSVLVYMASELSELGFIKWFSTSIGNALHGVSWIWVLVVLMIVYFYAHYFFASATAHVTAMYAAFVSVAVAAGAPAMLSAMLLALTSAIMASTTHYANGPASVLSSSGYVTQSEWWKMNFIMGIFYLLVYGIVGTLWMKLIGIW